MLRPPRVPLARLPTPLEPLEKLSERLGGPKIWFKRDDLTEGPAGGNKLRKLEYTLGQAQVEGASVLITAGAKQSNHCRATAYVAARLGLKCHLILVGRPPDSALDGNLLLDALMGAEISYISPDQYEALPQIFDEVSATYREQDETPFCIPLGASDEIGVWGYIDCVEELQADFIRESINPSHILAPIGSGGTHAGLMLGAELFGLGSQILSFSVVHDQAHFRTELSKIFCAWSERYQTNSVATLDMGTSAGTDSKLATDDLHANAIGNVDIGRLVPRTIDDYVEPGYGRANRHVYETIREVAALEGLILDPVYSGKALDGLVQEVRAGRFQESDDLVFIHTGGIYSVFPHRHRFP